MPRPAGAGPYAGEERSDPATASALAGVAVVSVATAAGADSVLELVVHPSYRGEGVGLPVWPKPCSSTPNCPA